MTDELYYAYWGKASPDQEEGARYHRLPYHCLDVAAVADQWWQQSLVLRRSFTRATGLNETQARAWVLFFIALHDYGKLDIRFQLKALEAVQALWPEYETDMADVEHGYVHGGAGYAWFMQEDSQLLGLSDAELDHWQPWLQAVTGHHGDLPSDPEMEEPDADAEVIERDARARRQWLAALCELFLEPAGLRLADPPPGCPELLAGFCSVCDWLGSDSAYFPYCSELKPLDDYWDEIQPLAKQALIDSGMVVSMQGDGGMSQLFPDYRPRQLQTLVKQLPLAPGLTLIEAPTGSGKTETALAYASRLLAEGLAESIIFALPTQATANAMLERLEQVAEKLYPNGSNLILAHGKARYNRNFTALKAAAERKTAQRQEDASVQCVRWLGASRKRVFLGQIGVCTIDQVLMSVLPVRHQFVRAFGVRKSVLIIDEVHAYDAYMYGLLGQVLAGQQAVGGTALLLSATLPEQQKARLVQAWGGSLPTQDDPCATPYPLLTHIDLQGKSRFFELPEQEQPSPRTVAVQCWYQSDMLPDERQCQEIVAAARQGALVGIVCNLVADAQQLATRLRKLTDVPVDLFHARYLFAHRQEKEEAVLRHYGKYADRKGGRILVATQVIEQSLDLDFDWLITQLCPVDLLFQRLGRLHRHERDQRPQGYEQPSVTVLLPEQPDYRLHELIYGCARILWRTQQKLEAIDFIHFPAAYRDWIEPVYQLAPWPDEPVAMTQSHETFMEQQEGSYFSARQLSNARAIPLPDTEGAAAKLTRDGEMSLNLILLQETDRGIALLGGRLLSELEEYEKDEQLNLNTVGVPQGWGKWLPKPDENDCYRLVMEPVKGEGNFECWLYRHSQAEFIYSKDFGLEKREL